VLCHRLGDANVASIDDIDPELVEQARQHLATLDYAPTLATGDGAAGVPDAAPYGAILATAAVDHILPSLDRAAPHGRDHPR
jgi:protein-L-isoaspartate O-methyltransferase